MALFSLGLPHKCKQTATTSTYLISFIVTSVINLSTHMAKKLILLRLQINNTMD
jgi:hypothetical protein